MMTLLWNIQCIYLMENFGGQKKTPRRAGVHYIKQNNLQKIIKRRRNSNCFLLVSIWLSIGSIRCDNRCAIVYRELDHHGS